MLHVCQEWAERNRMSINVNKTKVVVFLEDPAMRNARPRFDFTLTPAFPVQLPANTRIKVRQELRVHRLTTSAAQESVRIPQHSLGLIVKIQGNDTAIVDVEGIGNVELCVQDLEHISYTSNTHMDPPAQCLHYYGPSGSKTEALDHLTAWKTALRGRMEIWRCWGCIPCLIPSLCRCPTLLPNPRRRPSHAH